MSIFSMILGLIASGFAINGAGNLKEAWNKDYNSFKNSSFFSEKAKWGMNVAKKSTETVIPALIAVESFSGGAAKTAALQSVVDMVGGKLPKNGEQMSKTLAKVEEDLTGPFRSSKTKSEKKQEHIAPDATTNSVNQENTATVATETETVVQSEGKNEIEEPLEKPVENNENPEITQK